eukprot:508532-Rhodomonas_salina.2
MPENHHGRALSWQLRGGERQNKKGELPSSSHSRDPDGFKHEKKEEIVVQHLCALGDESLDDMSVAVERR